MSVLGYEKIRERFDEIFVEGGDLANVKGAKYILRLSSEYLILPDGTRCPPERPGEARFIVEPGQSAFVSTVERIAMPRDLIGIIGPRFTNAEHGVLFFGGMLVDPGYGFRGQIGEPLHMHLANVGSTPVELRPGEDEIASIAFIQVEGAASLELLHSELSVTGGEQARTDLFRSDRKELPVGALGLVEDMNRVRKRVEKLDTTLNQVVMFGVIVLAITFLAAVLSAVLSVEGSQGADANAGDALWASVGVTVAILVLSVGAVAALFFKVASWVLRYRQERRRFKPAQLG